MVIDINNLVKRYDKLIALNHFNLQVKQGEILGLLGPNGSGKTTAINCMLSLLKYDKGSIQLFGQEMKPTRFDLKQKIGVVPQEIAVFDELTVEQNINYFCGLYIKNKQQRQTLVNEAIQMVELQDFQNFLPAKLSGGLKRRLNIACGIAHQPELIFLDEPTVAVDPQSRNKILESVQQLNQRGATIVYTSHYMEEIEQICSKVVIMDHGEVIAEGTKESLKESIRTGGKVVIEIPALDQVIYEQICAFPTILEASYAEGFLIIKVKKDSKILVDILRHLEKEKVLFGNFYSEQPTLNDVFLEITGKTLRD